ncbi:MAG: DUF2029 domain-containing protein [Lachnospiraceae bacterium]|nr:DUF2029 domain-containing protein [Lachnospiraceae bacterium]
MKKYAVLYVSLTMTCVIFLISHFVSSHGEYARYFFWKDEIDTGMDFVNSLAETVDAVPYSRYHSIYPPVANAYFYALQTMLPDEVKSLIPDTHEEVVGLRQTVSDLRMHQSVLLLLVLHSVLSVLSVFCIVVYKFRSCGAPGAMFIGEAAILSYGSLYAIERGNVILLTAGLLMLFLFGYDSLDPGVRSMAYCSLVLSACVKIYPAIFGLMLFDGKKHGRALWIPAAGMTLSGLFLSLASFCLFGGIKDIPVFLNNLLAFNSDSGCDLYSRYGMRGIVEHAMSELYKHTGISLPDHGGIADLLLALSIAALLFSVYTHFRCGDAGYRAAFDLSVIAVLFQTQSSDYMLCLFIPVILMLIWNEPEPTQDNAVYFILLLGLVLPYYTRETSDRIDLLVHHVEVVQFILLFSVGYEFVTACIGMSRHSSHHNDMRHFRGCPA